MINFIQGWVRANEDSPKCDVNVRAMCPTTLKGVLIGGGLILAGIGYITYEAFVHGSYMHELAEVKALQKIGCLGGCDDVADVVRRYGDATEKILS